MILDGYQREVYMQNDNNTVSVTVTSPDIPKMTGWICPVCGRGLSPYTSVCPCKEWGKGWEVTC